MQSFINFILFTYFCSTIIFVFLCIYYCTCQITANPRENIGKINYCTNFQHSLVNSCEAESIELHSRGDLENRLQDQLCSTALGLPRSTVKVSRNGPQNHSDKRFNIKNEFMIFDLKNATISDLVKLNNLVVTTDWKRLR